MSTLLKCYVTQLNPLNGEIRTQSGAPLEMFLCVINQKLVMGKKNTAGCLEFSSMIIIITTTTTTTIKIA
jgi:hypothetical protein